MPETPAKRNRGPIIMGSMLAFAIVVIVIAALVGHGSSSGPGPSSGGGSATYSGTIDSIDPIDPAEVQVHFTVTNNGSSASKPSCTVHVSSPGSAYDGFDIFDATDALQPGASKTYSGTITVTHQGAQYVDMADSKVTCK